MATTVVRVLCLPGTAKVYLTSPVAGTTGTPDAGGYTPTQVEGLLHTISVTEALVGRFRWVGGTSDVASFWDWVDLVDEETTIDGGTGYVVDDADDAALTGDYTLDVTVVDDADDAPIEAAKVRMFRTGQTGSQTTDSDGETQFGLDAATWNYVASAAGYTSATGTKTIAANDTLEIRLSSIVIAEASDPDTVAAPVKCVDNTGVAEADVIVEAKHFKIPGSSTGYAFDGSFQQALSNGSGVATLTVIRGGTYKIRRSDSEFWTTVLIPLSGPVSVTSVIGP